MSAATGPLSPDWAGKALIFLALCTGRPSQSESAAIASPKTTILIGLLFPFLGRDRKKLRCYCLLLARDIQAVMGGKTLLNDPGKVCSRWEFSETSITLAER